MATSEKRFGCFGVFIVALLCLSLVFNVFFVLGDVIGFKGAETHRVREVVLTEPASKTVTTKIAVIRLTGLISSGESGLIAGSTPEDIKQKFRQAHEDKSVSAIILAIDSPGGEVTASDDI